MEDSQKNEIKTKKRGNPQNLQNGGPGRPKGQKNYKTIYREALIAIGKKNGRSYEEMERLMQEVGIKKAMSGNYSFWNDINNRIYGKVEEKVSLAVKEEPSDRVRELAKKLNK